MNGEGFSKNEKLTWEDIWQEDARESMAMWDWYI